MSNVLEFRRRGASREVINNLVKLGYLKQTMRRDAGAIEDALARLQIDLLPGHLWGRSTWLLSKSDDENIRPVKQR
jgi:hypothetical protein